MDFLQYADGTNSLEKISKLIKLAELPTRPLVTEPPPEFMYILQVGGWSKSKVLHNVKLFDSISPIITARSILLLFLHYPSNQMTPNSTNFVAP